MFPVSLLAGIHNNSHKCQDLEECRRWKSMNKSVMQSKFDHKNIIFKDIYKILFYVNTWIVEENYYDLFKLIHVLECFGDKKVLEVVLYFTKVNIPDKYFAYFLSHVYKYYCDENIEYYSEDVIKHKHKIFTPYLNDHYNKYRHIISIVNTSKVPRHAEYRFDLFRSRNFLKEYSKLVQGTSDVFEWTPYRNDIKKVKKMFKQGEPYYSKKYIINKFKKIIETFKDQEQISYRFFVPSVLNDGAIDDALYKNLLDQTRIYSKYIESEVINGVRKGYYTGSYLNEDIQRHEGTIEDSNLDIELCRKRLIMFNVYVNILNYGFRYMFFNEICNTVEEMNFLQDEFFNFEPLFKLNEVFDISVSTNNVDLIKTISSIYLKKNNSRHLYFASILTSGLRPISITKTIEQKMSK